MTKHTCEAIVITCIDFRLQAFIENWLKQLKSEGYDRVALAGGCKNFDTILVQIEISKRLHDIKKVILINHEDCGAYGETGTPEKHAQDLKETAKKISEKLADLKIESYYLHLDGTFEKIT
jgi:carbonic anhydrase